MIVGPLREVLTLTRWSDPDHPYASSFEPGPSGQSGHQIRLFVCAVLLRAEAEPTNQYVDIDPESTLAQCLASARVLGTELSEAVAGFLTWRIPRMERNSEPLLFALGLLILAIRLRSGRFVESVLGAFAEWVLSEEAIHGFSLRSGYWQPLATELMDEAAAIRADDVRTNLELCELLLERGCDY
jgi:hypothetical protein